MKLNIANPTTGGQKTLEIDDEKKVRIFFEKKMAEDVAIDALGDQFKGYVVRITGGHDRDGFPMKAGVFVNKRVRLLLDGHTGCFHPRRKGQKKRKSVRGCIVGPDIAVINCVVVKKGTGELEGITNKNVPRRLGPKRASKIKKLFNLSKEDDVRRYVVRREIKKPNGKTFTKAPKIQRLVTPLVIQHRKRLVTLAKRRHEKSKQEAADYAKLVAQLNKTKREALASKKQSLKSKNSLKGDSKSTDTKKADTKKADTKKADTKKTGTPAKTTTAKGGKAKGGQPKGQSPQPKQDQQKKASQPKVAAQPKQAAQPKGQPKQDKPKQEKPKQEKPVDTKAAQPKGQSPQPKQGKKHTQPAQPKGQPAAKKQKAGKKGGAKK